METIAIEQRRIARTVSVQFKAEEADESDLILLPYARPLKGRVLMDLHVTGSDGSPLRTLSYPETTSLLFSALEVELSRVARGHVPRPQLIAVLEIFSGCITARDLDPHEVAVAREAVAQILHPNISRARLQRLLGLLEVVATRRPLIAQLVTRGAGRHLPTEVIEVNYSFVEVISGDFPSVPGADGYEEKKQRVRQAMLVAPNIVNISVGSSRACVSYQARVKAPAGYYICDCVLWDRKSGKAVPNLDHGRSYSQFASWARRSASNSSELHTTNLGDTNVRSPYYLVRIGEIPPGSLGRAFIASLSVLLTVWIAGVLFSGLSDLPSCPRSGSESTMSGAAYNKTRADSGCPVGGQSAKVLGSARYSPGSSIRLRSAATQSSSGSATQSAASSSPDAGQATDVVAFILGVPAVLGAWLGLTGSSDRTFMSTLARLSLIVTAFLSAASAALYLIHARRPYTALRIPGGRNVLFVNEWIWAALLYIALVNVFVVTCAVLIRLRRFRRVVARRTGSGVGA